MNRRTLIGVIIGALLLAGLTFGVATFAAERHSEQRSDEVAQQASADNSATQQASDKGDKANDAYTDSKLGDLSDNLAVSVETSQVISSDMWAKNTFALTDVTGTTYLFSVNSPDSPGAAMFRVPVNIDGKLTVSEIKSGNIDMSSGLLTVNGIKGSNFLIGGNGNAQFASVTSNANTAVGSELSVGSKATVDGDFYAGALGGGKYGLQYNFVPGENVRSLTLTGPISASEIRIGAASKLGSTSFATDDITANKTLTSNGTLLVADASNLNGGLTVQGDTNLKDTNIDGKLTVAGDSTLKKLAAGATLLDSLEVKGDTHLDKNLQVDGDTNLKNKLTVVGATNLADTTVSGLVDTGTLKVIGDSTLAKVTAGSTTVDSLTDKGNLDVGGNTNLKDTTVDGKLQVTDDTNLKDTTVDGKLTVSKDAKITGAVTASGLNSTTLKVDDKSTLGEVEAGAITGTSLGLTGDITGATTINARGDITTTGGDINAASGTITAKKLDLTGDISNVNNIKASETITANALEAQSLKLNDDNSWNGAGIKASQLTAAGEIKGGTLVVQGAATFEDAATFERDATFENGITLGEGAGTTDAIDPGESATISGVDIVVASPTEPTDGSWYVTGHTIHLDSNASAPVAFQYIGVKTN